MAIFSIFSFSYMAIKRPSSHFFIKRAVGKRTCYYPNGEIAKDDLACDFTTSDSPCCLDYMNCLLNKMCRPSEEYLIRGSCTDPTWKSPYCPQYCTEARNGGTYLISCQNVTNSSLDYCCERTGDCCDTGVGRFRLPSDGESVTTPGLPVSSATSHLSTSDTQSETGTIQSTDPVSTPLPSQTSSSSASAFTLATDTIQSIDPVSTPLPSQTSSSSASAFTLATDTIQSTDPVSTPLPSQTSSSSASAFTLSNSTKAGIGTGVSLGAIIIVILSVLLWQSKRKNENSRGVVNDQNSLPKGELDANEPQRPDNRVRELQGDMAHELEASRDGNWIWELPTE